MPTRRGWTALAAGMCMWVVARLIGLPDLYMVAVGVVALPLLALAFVRVSNPRIEVHRNLSTARATLGARITISIRITNHGRATTSFLLLEDARSAPLGRPARAVVSGIPPRCDQTVTYTIVCRQRGRYQIGPLTVFLTDPFGLARARFDAAGSNELVVYPEIEDISTSGLVMHGAGSGEAAVRHLHRSAAEFYTMRAYVQGDDLRRIHWPSVARTGELMIRQDESTRRSSAIVFLDNRQSVLGSSGTPGFERAVSVAATLGRALARRGFAVRLVTAERTAVPATEENMLETLAGIVPSRTRSIAPALAVLRAGSPSEATVVVVTAPPFPAEIAAITGTGATFGRRIAAFVYPRSLAALAGPARAEVEGRASAAATSLRRAGWDVFLVQPDGKLATVWNREHMQRRSRRPAVARSS